MSVQILSRRSSVLKTDHSPRDLVMASLLSIRMQESPDSFFKDSGSGLIKAGPTFVGATAPNASGVGFTSSSKGESWLDTASTHILKINDGTSFQTVKAVVSRSAGQPTSPVDGQLHYDTTASNFLMYDADAAAWVTL